MCVYVYTLCLYICIRYKHIYVYIYNTYKDILDIYIHIDVNIVSPLVLDETSFLSSTGSFPVGFHQIPSPWK